MYHIKELISSPYVIGNGQLIACIGYEAIRCRKFPQVPRNFNEILKQVNLIIENTWEKVSIDFSYKRFYNVTDLYSWILTYIIMLPEIRQLNITQIEWDLGIRTLDDPRRRDFLSSPGHQVGMLNDQDHDFVDLDAFGRNLMHDLLLTSIDISYENILSDTIQTTNYFKDNSDES